jgi:hypothetical protein
MLYVPSIVIFLLTHELLYVRYRIIVTTNKVSVRMSEHFEHTYVLMDSVLSLKQSATNTSTNKFKVCGTLNFSLAVSVIKRQ